MKRLATAAMVAASILAGLAPAGADTLKVGMVAPFSGPFARWGTQMERAIEVYQKQNGKSVNGTDIEFVFRDTGGPDPAKSAQVTKELLLREKVTMLAGYVFTPNAAAVADLVNQADIPTLLLNAATASLTRESKNFVRDSQTIPQLAAPAAKWAAEQGMKKAVSLVADYAPGYDAEEYFDKEFTAAGGEILEKIRIPLSTTDFAPLFERALADKPDVILLFGPGGPFTVNMINAWSSRLKPQGVKAVTVSEPQQIDLPNVGPAAEGVVSSLHYAVSLDNPLNNAIKADMISMYGDDAMPDLSFIQTYDGIHMIYAAVEKFGAGVTAEQALSLWAGMEFDSPRGPVVIDKDTRDIVQNVYLREAQMVDGKMTNIVIATVPMVKDPWKIDHPE